MSLTSDNAAGPLVDHLFRHEAGKMVAVLTRLFGIGNMSQAEDIVHDTLLKALESWKFGNIPANPEAWLYMVARNKAIDLIRRNKLKRKIDNDLTISLQSEYTLAPAIGELFGPCEIADSQLRMMFACCYPALSAEAQITLILNVLCGLSAKEIAAAFLTQTDTINKRLYRSKERLRKENKPLDYPGEHEILKRTETVLKALYLLFSEGYCSAHPDLHIREDLCEEAMRLVILLTEHPKTNLPQANALMALMCYQASRLGSRINDNGNIVLLEDQDRSKWHKYLVEKGNDYLVLSANGPDLHEYQIEAAIAGVHANSASFDDTDWQLILRLYDRLVIITGNPVAELNRCIALARTGELSAAVEKMESLSGISDNYYYKTSLGELNYQTGNIAVAKELFEAAFLQANTLAEKELLQRKLELCCF